MSTERVISMWVPSIEDLYSDERNLNLNIWTSAEKVMWKKVESRKRRYIENENENVDYRSLSVTTDFRSGVQIRFWRRAAVCCTFFLRTSRIGPAFNLNTLVDLDAVDCGGGEKIETGSLSENRESSGGSLSEWVVTWTRIKNKTRGQFSVGEMHLP